MRIRKSLLATTMLTSIAGGVSLLPDAGSTADISTLLSKTPYASPLAPAIDGFNVKLDGLGGSFSNLSLAGMRAAFSIPLAQQYGLQIDAAAGSFDHNIFGSISGHLFWRDPAQGLFGLYVSHIYWDRYGGVHATQIAGEGAKYWGAWTLEGIAGIEFGNSASNIVPIPGPGTLTDTYDIRTRFFDKIDLAYYMQENLKVFIGHRYLGGKNALALGSEWGMPLSKGTMASLFLEGRVGEDEYRGIWGGLRFYFGQKDKSLIARHRQDDPIVWTPETLFSLVNNRRGPFAVCPGTEIFINGRCN